MQQNVGPSRVTAVPLGSGDHNDELLRAVRDAAAGSHEVLGEMGRDAGGRVIYLARDLKSAGLVALRLDGKDGDYVLDVARTLDATVGRAISADCGRCGAPLVGWGKFCPQCGADVAHAVTESGSRQELLDAVRAAARDEFEILGEMDRAEGGGVVYFARDLASGKVVTLRLRKEQDAGPATDSYSLGETQVLRPLVNAIGAAAPVPPATAPAAAPVTAPSDRVPPAPTLAKSLMPRLTPQEVLIPADQMPVDETLPPRPTRQVPPWMIAGGAVALVGVLAAAVFVHARLTAPDATRMDSVVAQAGQGPLALPPIDTAHVMVSDRVPATARLTVNGIVWQPPAIALPPGTYTLGAELAGSAPVTETVTLKPGQTLLWSPALAAPRDKSARAVAASRPEPRKESPRPAAQPTRKSTLPAATTAASAAVASAPSVSCSSAYGSKDWASALTACTREAQAGEVNAQRNLGAMYLQGYGVPRDPTQAFTWFKKAADAGSRDGAYQLALMYEAGRGVPRDATQATAWYKKAALLGDVDSQVKVGMAYENGTGVDVDVEQAVLWYRKAADQGSAWAQNRLGWLYGMGKGVNRDDAQAVKFFRAAADQGDPQAEFNVGFMYANGRGVPQDDSAAVSWFRKAAAQGWADAKKELKRRGLTQ
jgi:TPR repeat protein